MISTQKLVKPVPTFGPRIRTCCSRILTSRPPTSRNRSQSDESIRHYREYFAVNPTSFELWNNLGLLSHQKHKKLASIACFRRAVYLNPIDSVAWLNLALLYLHNGQLISALNAINSTLALSRDSMAFDVFGLVLMLLGQARVHRQSYHGICICPKSKTSMKPRK